jgi:SAM-dependent methyltransferase
MQESGQEKKRHRKHSSVVSQFIREQYGIGLKDIYSKTRAVLLEEVESVSCNLCGSDERELVAERDKYKLSLNTVMCRKCGLIYLNPRPTARAYQKHYEQGGQEDSTYHRRIEFENVESLLKFYYGSDFRMDHKARAAMDKYMAKHGVERDRLRHAAERAAAKARANGKRPDVGESSGKSGTAAPGGRALDYYGKHLYEQVKDYVPVGGKVFEPGASWGKLLLPWKVLHGCEVTGVEPKKAAVQAAKDRLGIELMQGFANDPRIPENTYNLVFNSRTINHMLDPLGDLRNAWRWLKPGGIVFVDIADATQETRFEGFERNVVEVDHPYMFSMNTLSAMVQKAGFVIVKKELLDLQSVREWDDRDPQTKQIRIIARKSLEPVPVDWPDPLTELARLARAQQEFDRAQAVALQKIQNKLKRTRSQEQNPDPPGAGRAMPGAKQVQRLLSSFGSRLRKGLRGKKASSASKAKR